MIRRILVLGFVIGAAWAALGGLIYLAMTGESAGGAVEVKRGEK